MRQTERASPRRKTPNPQPMAMQGRRNTWNQVRCTRAGMLHTRVATGRPPSMPNSLKNSGPIMPDDEPPHLQLSVLGCLMTIFPRLARRRSLQSRRTLSCLRVVSSRSNGAEVKGVRQNVAQRARPIQCSPTQSALPTLHGTVASAVQWQGCKGTQARARAAALSFDQESRWRR